MLSQWAHVDFDAYVGSFSCCSAHCSSVLFTCTREMVLYEGKYSEMFVIFPCADSDTAIE